MDPPSQITENTVLHPRYFSNVSQYFRAARKSYKKKKLHALKKIDYLQYYILHSISFDENSSTWGMLPKALWQEEAREGEGRGSLLPAWSETEWGG